MLAAVVAASLVVGSVALGVTTPTKAQMLAGKKVYVVAGCGKCHTLTAAKSRGTVGPNLNTIKPSLVKINTQVTQGGRFMPPFGASAGGSLSSTQIKNVAAFVWGAEHHKI
jgi:mono/diheme cytochrome c family protein